MKANDKCARLHNVKFYNLAPRAINCLAYNSKTLKLALSRNDTIEVWDMRNAPFMERTMGGGTGTSIESICWVNKELLSAGLNGRISHWNLKSLSVRQELMITGNAIWCMDSFEHTLAAGTEEGYLNICEIEPEIETLQYVRIMDKQDGRILCCKFDLSGKHLVTGSLDVLRVWDVKSGHVVHKMTTGRSEAKRETVIWSVLVLKDMQIASADSRGKLTLWDGNLGTQVESYQALKADALCLATDEKEEVIYVSGIEPIICSYTLTNFKRDNQTMRKWIRTTVRYPHTHDVKALFVMDEKVVSGGVDGFLGVTIFKDKFYNKYGPFLQKPSITVTENRLILLKYLNYIEIWRLGRSSFELEAFDEDQSGVEQNQDLLELQESPLKLVELLSKNKERILCCSISNDGKWFIYSTDKKIRLFQLQTKGNEKAQLTPLVPNVSLKFSPSCLCLFSTDSRFLYLYKTSGQVDVFEIIESELELDHKQTIDTNKYARDTVHMMRLSKCDNYLVLASLCCNVIIYHLEDIGRRKTAPEWTHYMNLPKYVYPAVTLSIHPTQTTRLVVSYADGKLIEYDMKELGFSFSTMLVQNEANNFVTQNIVLDPRNDDLMLVQNEKSIEIISKKIIEESRQTLESDSNESMTPKKLKRHKQGIFKSDDKNNARNVIKEAKHFVHLEWLNKDELVGVELNPVSLLEQLPPTLRLKKYGTG